jgi:glycosyltransferase involved in cell wall biosynthesis
MRDLRLPEAAISRRSPGARAGGGDRLEDRLHFLGDLPQDAVGAWFAAAEVAIVPSVRDDSGNVDGLPNTVLEALASGTPLVGTPAGGIGSVIEDGQTGVIVPERDARALATAVGELLDDPERRSRLGRASRAVEARFVGRRGGAIRIRLRPRPCLQLTTR